jgi:bacillithiol biosynthesis cysteine-adding enzyme BshC
LPVTAEHAFFVILRLTNYHLMPTDCISYQNSGYFSTLINDYLNQKSDVKPLYHRFPSLEAFKEQLQEKSESFPRSSRSVLVAELNRQYAGLDVTLQTKANISALGEGNTFTVTTGHQLNLFTGPLYFLYKIVTAVNLAKELKTANPDYNFVPVYWMATEDHDFDEINYFNYKGKKFRWNRDASGPVGRLSTDGLDDLFQLFVQDLGSGKNAEVLRTLFENAYLEHANLTDATRYLANELFGHTGLVIIDSDRTELKRLFIPQIKDELLSNRSYQEVTKTSALLQNYNIQVNPREINLFYIQDGLRERIIKEAEIYKVNNTSTTFSEEQILQLLDSNPECFSPNVILRPLYQECILPNICYIGGGGEIAYWLELKSMFEAYRVPFPILLLRNSVLIATGKQVEKADRLELSWADLFSNKDALAGNIVRRLSENIEQFEELRKVLTAQFEKMHTLMDQTDPSFSGAVKAQESKQLKGLTNLEKRYIKAEKRKHADKLERVHLLQSELFPNGSLQERQVNFAEFYHITGSQLIDTLLEKLDPLSMNFTIIEV